MRNVLIQPAAAQDLLDIWEYIARDNATAANRVVDRLESAINRLAEMPGMGHTRADVTNADYRFWTIYSFVVAYRYDDASPTVVRIIHGSRNFRKLFGKTEE